MKYAIINEDCNNGEVCNSLKEVLESVDDMLSGDDVDPNDIIIIKGTELEVITKFELKEKA